ncbi:HD domain-containing protein [Patescibacteria group bacterium]
MENIKELEERVRGLHLNPSQKSHSLTDKTAKEMFTSFWFGHVKPVIECAKDLAEKYGANVEVVWLAAIFHDISRLDDQEPHDEIGAEKTYKILLEEGFDEETARAVRDTILAHRCREHKPQTLEQKILATADAVCHFKTPFYLWVFAIAKRSLRDLLESSLLKIERDFNDKIFFDDEKESVRKEYEVLKSWFESWLNCKEEGGFFGLGLKKEEEHFVN